MKFKVFPIIASQHFAKTHSLNKTMAQKSNILYLSYGDKVK